MPAGQSNYPTSLDTAGKLPSSAVIDPPLPMDGGGDEDLYHDYVHAVANEAILALQAKLGIVNSTPLDTYLLLGTNTGETTWSTPTAVKTALGLADADVIAIVEGEATLDLTGNVTLVSGKTLKIGSNVTLEDFGQAGIGTLSGTSGASLNHGANYVSVTGGDINLVASGQIQLQASTVAATATLIGVTITATDKVETDTINEATPAAGVTIDGVLLKDSTLTLSPMTQGSIPFIGASGLVSQNNSQLFWDNASPWLGIGTNTKSASTDGLEIFPDVTPAARKNVHFFRNTPALGIGESEPSIFIWGDGGENSRLSIDRFQRLVFTASHVNGTNFTENLTCFKDLRFTSSQTTGFGQYGSDIVTRLGASSPTNFVISNSAVDRLTPHDGSNVRLIVLKHLTAYTANQYVEIYHDGSNGLINAGSAGDLILNGNITVDSSNLGFFAVTPVARAGATDEIKASLVAYGLLQGTSATSLDLDGGDLTAGAAILNDELRFDTGVAATAAAYQVLRNADGTNRLQYNVPTGAAHEFSVNDKAILTVADGNMSVDTDGALTLDWGTGQQLVFSVNGSGRWAFDSSGHLNALLAVYLKLGVFNDGNRGAAGTAGRVIFNTSDGQLNIDDGTNWTLPDGTTT